MRRRLGICALLAVLTCLAAAPAGAERVQEGNLRLLLDGDFSPRALPRDREVGVKVSFDGAISTTDGSHPPALRRLEIALNRNGRLTLAGLPTCRPGQLQSTPSAEALARCRSALVGRGGFRATIDSSQEPVLLRGRLLAFHSRQGGRSAISLHLYAASPIQAAFVLPMKVSRRAKGTYGTVLSARVPRLAGGRGSVTDVHLQVGRTYKHRGRRINMISARCAAPEGFSIGLFPFARASFDFAGGDAVDVSLTRSCRVR